MNNIYYKQTGIEIINYKIIQEISNKLNLDFKSTTKMIEIKLKDIEKTLKLLLNNSKIKYKIEDFISRIFEELPKENKIKIIIFEKENFIDFNNNDSFLDNLFENSIDLFFGFLVKEIFFNMELLTIMSLETILDNRRLKDNSNNSFYLKQHPLYIFFINY